MSLFWDAPLEGLADPMQTPNPAKAPWYFLGLQELLHYFPPVVGGVLIPTLVVLALVIIPYFNVNVEAEGLWLRNRGKRLRIFAAVVLALIVFLIVFEVWAVLAPTVLIAAAMLFAAREANNAGRFRRWLILRPLSFWIMTWFLASASLLTGIGTFFRGPGWSWVWPWKE
jgi:quinol-cytochrome oxidoreductase complex cytochrome b subunit